MNNPEPAPRQNAVRRSKKRKRPLAPIIITVVAVGLAWFAWAKTHPSVNPLSQLITAQVSRSNLTETVTATGAIEAQTGAQVNIGSQITGTIKKLNADVGGHVNSGQVIAELNLPDLEAQVRQSKATLQQAETRYKQDVDGKAMEFSQTDNAIVQAKANLRSAEEKLSEAIAAENQQKVQTPASIQQAQTALAASEAALNTANANYKQTVDGANLQIAVAKEQVTQSKANAVNSAVNLKRQMELYKEGYVAASAVDDARATDKVNQSQVASSENNLVLTQQKVTSDLESAKDQVTQAQENVSSAKAALTSAQSNVYLDKTRAAAVRDSQAQVNQSKAALTIAIANKANNILKDEDIKAAKQQVQISQAQLDYNIAELDKSFITSPISGTVLQLAEQQGETLAAGLSAPTLIIVANLHRLEADIYVDETDIGKIRLGQDADITVDAFPNTTFHGKVTKIASGSTIQNGVVTYDVSISLNSMKGLKPDMSANATIYIRKLQNALVVPAEAVNQTVTGSTVNVLETKNGKPTPKTVNVKTGISDGVNTQILSGLTEGQTIILAGMPSGGPMRGPSFFGPSQSNTPKIKAPAGGKPAGPPPGPPPGH